MVLAQDASNHGTSACNLGEPPIHRFVHGAFDISVFSDGFITLPGPVILPDTPPEQRPAMLEHLGGASDHAAFHVNIPLIRTGNDVILIDNGSGDKFQPSAGELGANLTAAGVDPGAVTKVIFTHLHPDHSGGTILPNGKLQFPNAEYLVNDAELRFWTNADYLTALPSELHGFARGAQRDVAAVDSRLRCFKAGDEVVNGIRAVATPGHTPGHVSFELAGGDGLLICGDVVTSNILFFENPSLHFGFDTDPELALRNRQAFLSRVAKEKMLMLGYHWAYPGLGFAERIGPAYHFVPV